MHLQAARRQVCVVGIYTANTRQRQHTVCTGISGIKREIFAGFGRKQLAAILDTDLLQVDPYHVT